MRRPATIMALYVGFAAFATAVNLGTQEISLQLYNGPMALTAAMALGTGTGLVTKYVLDKAWIFQYRSNSAASYVRNFTAYTLTGIATTALFWGAELAFNLLPPHGRWRLLGGALGLAAGYAIKYRLDRRFVFGDTR